MKKLLSVVFMALLGALLLQGCKKDDEKKQAISNDEAAELVGLALSSETGGSSGQFTDAIAFLATAPAVDTKKGMEDFCDWSVDTSNTFSLNGVGRTLEVNYHYTFGFDDCTFGIPQKFEFDANNSIIYNGTYYASTATAKSNWDITDFLATELTLNGSYSYEGSQTYKLSQRTITSKVNISFTDVKINKMNFTPQSGTAQVDISGTTTNMGAFTFSGTLTYKNDGTATLKINGETYTVNLTNGTVG